MQVGTVEKDQRRRLGWFIRAGMGSSLAGQVSREGKQLQLRDPRPLDHIQRVR